jgi:hypothetical protein
MVTTFGQEYAMAHYLEHFSQRFAYGGLIVYNQDRQRRCFHGFGDDFLSL